MGIDMDELLVRRAAIEILLSDPETIPDPLEAELYAYQEQLVDKLPS
jgi:hypothetical protein